MSGPFIVFLILAGIIAYGSIGLGYGLFYALTLEQRRRRCRRCSGHWHSHWYCSSHSPDAANIAVYLWPWALVCDLLSGLMILWRWAQPVAVMKRREERMTVLVKGRRRRD